MNASARSSIAKVMSPPSPAPAWALPAWPPRWGATRSRIAAASSSATRWGACPRAISTPLTAARRALAQLHVQVLGVTVADDLDGHGVAGLVAGDDLREVVLGDDLVPVDRDDHVPPDVVLICWLIPITFPFASNIGPPELPGLIEASVWIAPSIWNRVRDSIDRSVAETTPTDSDWSSPNGLPIAATGCPTWTASFVASRSGLRSRPFGSTVSSATSAFGSKPTMWAGTWLRSANWTKTSLAS